MPNTKTLKLAFTWALGAALAMFTMLVGTFLFVAHTDNIPARDAVQVWPFVAVFTAITFLAVLGEIAVSND